MLPLVLAGACRLPSIEKSRSEKTYIYDLGGGFKHFLYSPLFGEDSQFDYIIFFRWVETTNQLYDITYTNPYNHGFFNSPLRDFLTSQQKSVGVEAVGGFYLEHSRRLATWSHSRKLTSGFQKIPRLAHVVRSFNEVVAAITCDVVGNCVKNCLPLEWMDIFNATFCWKDAS